MAELDRPHNQIGGRPSWIDHTTRSADGQAGSTTWPAIRLAEPIQLSGWPSWIDDTTSSAIRWARSTTRPARPSTELNQSSSADGRAGTVMLSLSHPYSFFPEIRSNLLLSHLDRRRRWNFTTLKPQELVFSYEVLIYRMKGKQITKHLELLKSYENSGLSSESTSFRERSSLSREKRLSR